MAQYTDAVVGEAVTGLTILARWWAYPAPAGLRFGTYLPGVYDATPQAGLRLLGIAPTVVGLDALQPDPAGLGLGGTPPTNIDLSQILAPPSAGLLLGVALPLYVGPVWLHDVACAEIVLTDAECV